MHLQAAQQLAEMLGPQHSSSITAAAALALAYAKQSRLKEALLLYQRTARLAAQGLGKHHATTLDLRLGVADALQKLGRHDEAAAAGARLLRAQRALAVPSHNDQLRLARALELTAGAAGGAGPGPKASALPKRLELMQEAAEAQSLRLRVNRGRRREED